MAESEKYLVLKHSNGVNDKTNHLTVVDLDLMKVVKDLITDDSYIGNLGISQLGSSFTLIYDSIDSVS